MPESSRSRVNLPGYNSVGAIPGNAKKLQERAAAGQGQAILPEMFRTRPEKLVGPTGERNMHSLADITRGLGLDRVDEQNIQNVIAEFDPSFTPKAGQQRSFMMVSRLTETLRRSFKHIPADVRMELVTRARSYWRRAFPIDATREPTKRYGAPMKKTMFVIDPHGRALTEDELRKAVIPADHEEDAPPRKKKTQSGVQPKPKGKTQQPPQGAQPQKPAAGTDKPPQGFTPIPNSKKGGYHKQQGDKWIYWYPGQGITSSPDAADAGGQQQGAGKPGSSPGGPQKPGAPQAGPKGPQGAQQAASGPQKPGGAGGDVAPQFKPHADGMGDHDALHHHVSAREQHKAAARKHATKDPKRSAAHRKAMNEHTKAANDIVRRVGNDDPDKVRQTIDRARGKNVDSSEQLNPEQPPEQGSLPSEAGSDAPPFEGASDPEVASAEGYGRSPAGVRMGADGARETAAAGRTRTVPESQTVRMARESLGRAMNIMADLSAAHDQLGGLEAARQKVSAMPRGDKKRKHLLAQLDAEIAASKYDIVQLEGAHSHAMQEVSRVQTQMQTEQIEAHPIFKMFLLVMQKLQQFGDLIAERVEEIERKLSPEERERKKSAEIFAEAVKQAKGDGGPENILGISKEEINSLFGYNENAAETDAKADEALGNLDAMQGPAGDDDAEMQVGDDEVSEADEAMGEAVKTSQSGIEAKGKARAKQDESDSFDRDIASSKRKRDDAEKKAGAAADVWEQRNKGRSSRSVMREQLGDDSGDSRAPTQDTDSKGTMSSKPKRKKPTPEEVQAGTIATGSKKGKKAIKKSQYITHTRAFAWAMKAGGRMLRELRQTEDALRKAEAASHIYVVPTTPPRRVPFFFNELGG